MGKQHRKADVALAEPGDDWIPMRLAPFFYAAGYFATVNQWESHLDYVLPRLVGKVEFTLSVSEDRVASIIALECKLELHAWSGTLWLESCDDEDRPSVLVFGPPDDFFEKLESRSIPKAFSRSVDFHSKLAWDLLYDMQTNWSRAVRSGFARIMARPLSPLNEFTMLTLDQWTYFKLDEVPRRAERVTPWYALEPDEDSSQVGQLSATGTAGERVFSLYVAPGIHGKPRRSQISAEARCTDWLIALMGKHGEERPAPRTKLAVQARKMFPGLAVRGFDRAMRRAVDHTQNHSWQRPGRPKKSL
jgi:hypothetical protein